MALARPWIWTGFNTDGSIKNPDTAFKSFVIPITSNTNLLGSSSPNTTLEITN